MKVVVEITPHDLERSRADNQPALMFALGRAGFKNAFIDPTHQDRILSATVSHIEAWVVKTQLNEDGLGFHHLELDPHSAVAFGLTVHDGLDRRERDDLLNPTIEPRNETTAELTGDLDNPSPNSERANEQSEPVQG